MREPRKYVDPTGLELEERVVDIWRCATVVKGGKRFNFTALVTVGTGTGVVGWGYGKAREVPTAIEKGLREAKKRLIKFDFKRTIPHEVIGKSDASVVKLIPAAPGTGVIAGAAVRAVADCLGLKDLLSKCYGSNNSKNVVKATLNGLRTIRTRAEVEKLRGVTLARRRPREAPEGSEAAEAVAAAPSAAPEIAPTAEPGAGEAT
ncbi:MAG: 30S ribosomal protein S5 [Planctomycetota bacterium]|jgi:small subunit ribosomal protein S5